MKITSSSSEKFSDHIHGHFKDFCKEKIEICIQIIKNRIQIYLQL